jgi:alpha-L-rhamnosidase
MIGTQWLMRKLTEYGRSDVAFRIATNRDYPGWGYMVERGATTIWELWNGDTANPAMNSHNHVMLLGDLIVWYYENLAGIKSAKEHQAFNKIEMKPSVANGLRYVMASYRSMYGDIKSSWHKNEKQFTWNIQVPSNTTAILYVPAITKDKVREGGKKIAGVHGITFLRMEEETAVFEVGSGNYSFTSTR